MRATEKFVDITKKIQMQNELESYIYLLLSTHPHLFLPLQRALGRTS